MDSVKVAAISFGNYALNFSGVHEFLQIIVALLSIVLLIRNIKEKK